MNTKNTAFLLLTLMLVSTSTVNAQISWGEPITAGSTTPKAQHINELRTQIENLRTDVDAGGAGQWIAGAGGDIYYNGGSVGIGVSSPTGSLDATSTIRTNGAIQSGNASGGVALTVNDGYGNANITFNHLAGRPEQNGNVARIEVNTDATSGGYMSFRLADNGVSGTPIDPSRILHLLSNGNVGIGTASPTSALHIGSNADISSATDVDAGLLIGSSGAFLAMDGNEMQAHNGTAAANYALQPFGGNIGIGKFPGADKLDVNGDIRMSTGRSLRFGDGDQRLYGDNGSATYHDSNHSTVSQMIFRDKEDDVYGRLYGSNGDNFGLMDGDGNWGIQMAKDNYTRFLVNNSEKMRIQTNGNVGIGTTSPSFKLDVSGDARMQVLNVYGTGVGTGGYIFVDQLGDGGGGFITESNLNGIGLVGNQGRLATPDLYVTDAGNVGIGTTTPTRTLEVQGTGMRLDHSSTAYDLWLQGGAAGSGDDRNLAILGQDEDSGDKLFINHAGEYANGTILGANVGIGTTAPTAKLHAIADGVTAKLGRNTTQVMEFINNSSGAEIQSLSPVDNAKGLTLDSTNPSNAAATAGDNYIRFNVRGNEKMRIENSGDVGIGIANPTAKLHVVGDSVLDVSGGGDFMLRDTSKGTVDNVIWYDRSAGRTYLGNTGGSGANAEVTVRGDLEVTGAITGASIPGDNLGNHTATAVVNANDNEVRNVRAIQLKDWDDDTGGTDNKYRLLARDGAWNFYDGGIVAGRWANDTFTDVANGRIIAQNRIGVGTDPSVDIHVKKNGDAILRLEADADNVTETDNPRIDFYQDGGSVQSRIGYANGTNTFEVTNEFNDHLIFGTNNAEHVRITNTGLVGIGKTTPASKLDVAGHIVADDISDSNFMQLWADNALIAGRNGSLDRMRFAFADGLGAQGFSEKMSLTDTGRLGIGVSAPEKTLHVNGDFTLEGGTNTIHLKDPGTGDDDYLIHQNAHMFYIMRDNNDNGTWDDGEDDRIVVSGQANGVNLGIGTNSPAHKLDVNGNIRATGRNLYLGGNHLVGDNGSALYIGSNNSNTTQVILRDAENTIYGRLYGAGNGSDFGLLDGDGNWGIRMTKDNNTRFLINNSEKMRILSDGSVGIGFTDPATKLDVNGHIRTPNQVRANNICDPDGNNCTSTTNIYNGVFSTARYNPGAGASSHPNQVSSRHISTALNYPGKVTFYSADQDTANFLCREKTSKPFGYWKKSGKPDSSGWAPYGNLAITAYDPTSVGSRKEVCTTGSACYNGGNGFLFGEWLECFDMPGFPTPNAYPAIS